MKQTKFKFGRPGKPFKVKLSGGPFAGCSVTLFDLTGTLPIVVNGKAGRYGKEGDSTVRYGNAGDSTVKWIPL